jgi:hypothetical protein
MLPATLGLGRDIMIIMVNRYHWEDIAKSCKINPALQANSSKGSRSSTVPGFQGAVLVFVQRFLGV